MLQFLYSRGQRRHYEIHFEIFQNIFNVFIFILLNIIAFEVVAVWRSDETLWPKNGQGDHASKTLRMQTAVHDLSGVPCGHSLFQYLSIRVAGLRAQGSGIAVDFEGTIMLYGNMEQLTELRMPIFVLLAWTN